MNPFKLLHPKRMRDFRCSFCHKSQRDVQKLVAGPRVYICNECVAITSDLVAPDEKAHLKDALSKGEASLCIVCNTSKAAVGLLHVPNRGPVCYVCVAAIKVAAGKGWDFRSE